MAIVLAEVVRLALVEDAPWGDGTSELLISADETLTASMIAREPGIMSGAEVICEVFEQCGARAEICIGNGKRFETGATLAVVSGQARGVLRGERVALNFVQRLTAIATRTAEYVDATSGTKARIVDTRKTTPGLRILEKQAVLDGGGYNHRMSLSDALLIKDNHVAAIGGLKALGNLRERVSHVMHIEIEVDRLDQIEDAITAGADSVLCDNFTIPELRQAVEIIDGRALVNASGGVTLDTVHEVANTGVDLISVGAITHNAGSLDIGLDIE